MIKILAVSQINFKTLYMASENPDSICCAKKWYTIFLMTKKFIFQSLKNSFIANCHVRSWSFILLAFRVVFSTAELLSCDSLGNDVLWVLSLNGRFVWSCIDCSLLSFRLATWRSFCWRMELGIIFKWPKANCVVSTRMLCYMLLS